MRQIASMIIFAGLIGCGGSDFTAENNDPMPINSAGVAGSNGMSGAAGSINGTGGTVNTGGSSTGGIQNTGGSECVPKTCMTLGIEMSDSDTGAYACGVLEDGCGNYIDCGTGCEEFEPSFTPSTAICNTETNLCEERCTREWEPSLCGSYGGSWLYTCEPSGTVQTQADDYPYHNDPNRCTYVVNNQWCCIHDDLSPV